MQATIQSILEAEQNKKQIIENALKLVDKSINEENTQFEASLKKLDEDSSRAYEEAAPWIKAEMKEIYNQKWDVYLSQVKNIKSVSISDEEDKVLNLFIESIN